MHSHRLHRLGPALLLLVIPGLTANAATLQVPGDHTTIQAALDAASVGDTVLVSSGTYLENGLTFGGKDLVLRSASGPDATIIDGSGVGPVFLLDGNLTRAATVEGFTVRNGSSDNFRGAGIDVHSGAPTIRGNRIIDNRASQNGAGIKCRQGANPLIEANHIEGNSADDKGGGIQVIESTAEIRGNWIESNTATATSTSSGGGLNLSTCSGVPLVVGNTFRSNSATFSGGGLSALTCSVEVDGNTFEGNSSEFGGAAHFETGSAAVDWTVTNNRVLDNTASRHGAGLNFFAAGFAANAEVRFNTITGNDCANPFCTDGTQEECCQGGGLRASRGTGQETFEGNTVSANRADTHGAAVLLGLPAEAKTVTFAGNVVGSNRSRFNIPGVLCKGVAECRIRGNRFLSNRNDVTPSTSPVPGALDLREVGLAVVENNYFRDNEGRIAGAVLAASSGEPMNVLVRNNTFTNNSTLNAPDGTLRISVDGVVTNNLFLGDSRALSVRNSPALSVLNNDFFAYSVGVYKDEATTHATAAALNGEGFASANVELEPGFVNPSYVYLSPESSLIGAGSCGDGPSDDIDGESRPSGPGCEIGADEHDPATLDVFSDGFETGDTSRWSDGR